MLDSRQSALQELYKREFQTFAAEQETILPKSGVPCKLTLNPLQLIIDRIATDQWNSKGFIRIVVFKARQRGGTTYSVGRAAWRAYLNPNVSAIIISCDPDSTQNAFNKAELIYTELPPWLRPMRRYLNKEQIVLENPDPKMRTSKPGLRSRIECATAKNINAGVSTTRQVVCMSEMPRWTRTEEIRSSLLPTMPLDGPGTIVINEATPFGWGNGREEFRSWCDAARSGKDIYQFIELYWWMDPECRVARGKNEKLRLDPEERYWKKKCHLDDEQILYRRRMILELGKMDEDVGRMLFLQEFPSDYESAWQSAENPAFDRIKLKELTDQTLKPPLRRCAFEVVRHGTEIIAEIVDTSSGELWIWEEPDPNEVYDIGADCAPPGTGRNPDFSAFQVIKRRNKEQVAEWLGRPNVHDFAAVLFCIGRYYNDAHLGVEVNGIGYAVNEQLCILSYPNIYQWRLRQHAVPKYSQLTGWKTQDDTKKLMMAVTYMLLDHGELLIHSKRLKEEMEMYVHYYSEAGNDKWEAGAGHDDLLASFQIAQVISRDEDALGHSLLTIGRSRIPTLEERNSKLTEFMEMHQPGISDRGARMTFGRSQQHDPWQRLAREYGQKEDFE